jgi:hypothetical protein
MEGTGRRSLREKSCQARFYPDVEEGEDPASSPLYDRIR